MKKPVYLDYAATTPVDPAVAEEMLKYLTPDGVFGNPASRSHGFGWQAEAAVEGARRQVANLLHADPREIVWTSGATESDNLAIKGAVAGKSNPHVVTSMIEHKAVLDTCKWLEGQGVEVTWLKPGADGRVSCQQVEGALRNNTALVSLMMVNNELGSQTDIAAIGAMLRERGVLFHVDAAQAAGKTEVNVGGMPVDLLSLSGHKVYGPKGIGALYVRRSPDVRIESQIHGGGHERGMRSGTLPTHQIVGMGKAFDLAGEKLEQEKARLELLRKRFLSGLEGLEGVTLNGSAEHRVPGIINLSFAGVDAESLMLGLRELAVSSGSACSSATIEPSFVLKGIGLDDEQAHRALRFSFGRFSTEEEIDFAAAQIVDVVTRLRSVR
ncbi:MULTISPECIES: IscS subfamily cysteine desulfurase [unclassified Marinobacter]|jgi:cysteine desulfurase|uniref:IscS subfamily cysteine desulfurase n=1 Tax=unclassified Marinobacter TaxID=83889 RepID=UPI000C5E51C4|nr:MULTISPECIES: IscS subfamily cysteine desulfurase [unclassified Marinobacter]MAB50182.1 IscS subfamily cysteine desulfurase [Marinobacter sp.]MBE97297.1 IscS subfamily cysteine desulfurase [Marinobacter sp.]MBP54971.1 IscS subfamily cysteine desulfurase [Marinobacter sp.]|tara:strand:+ start:909 stop:2057 length:1149 start_codon:yes stop_codon:yes gene_type:complete